MTPVNDQPGLFDAADAPDQERPLFPTPRSGNGGRATRIARRGGTGRVPDALAGEDLETLAKVLESTGRYRVLRRFEERLDGPPEPQESARLHKAVYLDVETTGTNHYDKIIELALLEFHYDDLGRIARVSRAFDAFEDPRRTIPHEIVELTGITDDMVKGQRIDDDEVVDFVSGADIVIAHNAGFDRPFAERRFPVFRDLAWGCSVVDVDWAGAGYRGRKLEYLAVAKGYFYQAHRAIADCHVGVRILGDELREGGPTALAELLAHAKREWVRLWALGSPFEKKDELKSRYYRWNSQAKVWWCDLPAERHRDELEWLAANVYTRRPPLPYVRIDARLRYSARLPDAPPADCERL